MLDYVALAIMFVVGLIIVYGIIFIHDIPYDIAKRRNHPHQDAIHVAGWISLLTLHVIWPFLWIWATIYRPDRGYGFGERVVQDEERIARLEAEIADLREALARRGGDA